MPSLQVDLTGFTWPEVMVLVHHLQYAADRLRQEMDDLRQAQRRRYFYPKKAKDRPQGLQLTHWAGLIRDQRYFTGLARALEETLADWQAVLFISDGSPPRLDLSELQVRDNQPFIFFLERERERSRLATAYLQRESFDDRVRQDLLLALALEIRFFSRLLEQLTQSMPPFPAWFRPEEDRVPLLFVSLPRALISHPARTIPRQTA